MPVGDMVAPGGWGAAGSVYTYDQLNNTAQALATANGWTHPPGSLELELMRNGEIYHDDAGHPYVMVKFGIPNASGVVQSSTEIVYMDGSTGGFPINPGNTGGTGGISDPTIPDIRTRCFYDESAPMPYREWAQEPYDPFPPDDTWYVMHPNFGVIVGTPPNQYDASGPTSGFQFQVSQAYVTCDGVQVWLPDAEWDKPHHGRIPSTLTVRLWRNSFFGEPDIYPMAKAEAPSQPGWNNIYFPAPIPLDYTGLGHPGDPNTGFYTVGWGAKYCPHGTPVAATKPWLPEHKKMQGDPRIATCVPNSGIPYVLQDNYPALSDGVQRFSALSSNILDHKPTFGSEFYLFVGPIFTWRPRPEHDHMAPFKGIDVSFTDSPLTDPDWTQVDDKEGHTV